MVVFHGVDSPTSGRRMTVRLDDTVPQADSEAAVERVLVVDDEPLMLKATTRMLRASVASGGLSAAGGPDSRCEVDGVPDAAAALDLLRERDYAVLLTDYSMVEMDGIELCGHACRLRPDITCILVTGYSDLSLATAAMNRAEVHRFLTKPWERTDLEAAVRAGVAQHRLRRDHARVSKLLLQRERQLDMLAQQVEIEAERRAGVLIRALMHALDVRDAVERGHSRRVARYARRLGQGLGLSPRELADVEYGGLLHDIGKIGVRETILQKRGGLTDAEWVEVRRHPQVGYDMLAGLHFLESARAVVRSHHERFDGSGYPEGLSGESIPRSARIFAVVDAFDALTSDRPYRSAGPFAAAEAEIREGRGGQFDPVCADAFLAIPEAELDALRAEPDASFE